MPRPTKRKRFYLEKLKKIQERAKKRKLGLDENIENFDEKNNSDFSPSKANNNRLGLQEIDQNLDQRLPTCVTPSPRTISNEVSQENDTKICQVLATAESTSTLDHPNIENKFCISPESDEVTTKKIGRRIVDISYFSKQLLEVCNHGPLGCSASDIILIGEKQVGLMSKFTFKCQMCNLKFFINNDTCEDNYLNLNACAVAGAVSIGCGQSQLEEWLSGMNLPIITPKLYDFNHELASKHWEEELFNQMIEAGVEEKKIAISEGKVTDEGHGIIDVIVDGCWSKRSYKKNYSALSGAAAIIGKNTGKILYLGVKNKYCQLCAKAERQKKEAKDHLCFKNYTGPSTGMESQILVEGFKNSITQHGLVYGKLISDGDSSTYSKILQARPYKNITVEKIECRNHVLRNFCNKLQALTTETKYLLKHRKCLTRTVILTIRGAIIKAIRHHKTNSDVQLLFDDLLSCHLHAFGDHSRCRNYFCEKVGIVDNEKVPSDFFFSTLWQKISILIQGVAAHARSLIHDTDSNKVENFHSVVAKFIGGKRVNFSKKNSYKTRVQAAAVAINAKKSVSRLYKSITGKSPTGRIKKFEEKRIKKNILNKKNKKPKRRLFKYGENTNKEYGDNCTRPDMDAEDFDKLKKVFLENLKKSDEDIQKIQKSTILQSESGEWLELRRSLLTASNFGKIIKRRNDTSCANLIKELLYKGNLDHVSSIKHGKENENKALRQLAEVTNKKIEKCGLFIDKEMPFLGATPDGISGEDEVIEVKCPITAHKVGIKEAISKRKITFWKINKQGNEEINTTHNWYFQVQGQLKITNRKRCIFAVWANENEPLKIEVIERDVNFWKQKMEEKLTRFYIDCLLPELVDPRHPRNLPIRNPTYIEKCIEEREKKKK